MFGDTGNNCPMLVSNSVIESCKGKPTWCTTYS